MGTTTIPVYAGTGIEVGGCTVVAQDSADQDRLPWEERVQLPVEIISERPPSPQRRRTATWPPCLPLLCHDIEHDIRRRSARPIARRSYFYWQLVGLMLLLNAACALVLFIDGRWSIQELGASLVLLVGYPILSFITWHLFLYTALRLNSTFFYLSWVIFFTAHLVFISALSIGIRRLGSRYPIHATWFSGLVLLIRDFSHLEMYAKVLFGITLFMKLLLVLLGLIHMRWVWAFLTTADHPV